MSATNSTKHSGNHDFQLGELQNVRVHLYDTLAHANADSANANGRICFVAETNNFYIGKSNVWSVLTTSGQFSVPSIIQLVVSSVTLTSSSLLYVKIDSTSGSFNITVPATAAEGDTVYIKDLGGALRSNPVYIIPGAQTIDGLSSNLELNRDYMCLILKYLEGHWVVLSDA
jgi:hypothetical protein